MRDTSPPLRWLTPFDAGLIDNTGLGYEINNNRVIFCTYLNFPTEPELLPALNAAGRGAGTFISGLIDTSDRQDGEGRGRSRARETFAVGVTETR